ncbi:MAG: hypothetical protein CYG60_20845 [Actinobacteria bacterium]|nr:MAG: hypothetical protein CYG60_20845 [Actinomycetota bacterium]
MSLSLYHSATGKQAPHCIHAIGIGKTGADMIEALLRTGEIEDMLEDPRARFTALAVDIGDGDMNLLREDAPVTNGDASRTRMPTSFRARLEDRGIPAERAQIHTASLGVPTKDELFESLRRYPEYQKSEFPRFYTDPNYEPWLPSDVEIPEAGEHFPRAIAKAIYGREYYEKGAIAEELDAFAESINNTKLPSIVLVFFALTGGTGSGIVVDLARHVSNLRLGRRIPVIGVGVLPFSEDDRHPEHHRAGSMFATLNELDCMLDEDKNQGVMAVWGDLYKNPFTGGFFLLPQEHAWQRLSRYTSLGVEEIRHMLRTGVTNKFLDDSFTRFIVQDSGRTLFKVMRPAGSTGAPHEHITAKDRNWTLFDIAKFTHPGVQVLPGEPMSKWREVIASWIEHIPQWSGLKEGFKTDYIEAHTVAARVLWNDTLQKKLEETLKVYLLPGDDSTLHVSLAEFFDELTCYTNIIIPGVAKTDLTAFWDARDEYDKLEGDEKLLVHSWLLDLGVQLSEPSELVSHDTIRGEGEVSTNRADITKEQIAMMTRTVVDTL